MARPYIKMNFDPLPLATGPERQLCNNQFKRPDKKQSVPIDYDLINNFVDNWYFSIGFP